ncbi:DUF3019 domain-containing protein [Rheinheimera sp.]|uniref:DUF3019 domain-containing protein n=1 Tax=Rheinheimera sp. TaxID=1869214 RepID=UPI00307D2482
MRTLVIFLIAFIPLTGHAKAEPLQFSLKPRLCLHYPGEPCLLQLSVQWQQQHSLCLFLQSKAEPLLCGTAVDQQLQLVLTEHSRLELRSQASGELESQRLIRVVQVDLNAGDQLLKRSRNWGTP